MAADTTRTRASTSASTPAQECALKLWVVLSRAAAAVEAHARADAARHDLTLPEFGILEVLHHKGRLLLGEVQRKILVSSGGITYLVDRLEARGLVERIPNPDDRRARWVALTAEGERLIARIFPEHAAVIERAVSALTAEEQETARELLRQLGRGAAGSADG
ncbi:MAG TPA: MarR family transcriptional regulator [Gemmatimonadaceae bacterium]|nr:MarR family transcriptional regulator [Gemmatimonadaceae bacterium]